MKDQELPNYKDLLWPTLKTLEKRGGSASIQELSEGVASELALSEEILDRPHSDGPRSEVDYRAAWARTALKAIGALENTTRGVWTITDAGRAVQSEEQLREQVRQDRKQRYPQKGGQSPGPGDDDDAPGGEGWEEAFLSFLRGIKPDAFERLCQRILRESGFTKVEVTGRSGDGGIDGAGVLRVNLISFHVRFQCKRYTGSVGPGEIRDFRGAMVGRADKGLFITTGRFTRDAAREAERDGAPAIDLIDGIDLCNLLQQLDLGVETVVRPRLEFFEGL
ncbi:MAG: restriction endonuclease [Acidobacteriia bacterium]|nr:restriction endonuclease [Terriglobia bacterium]